MVDSSRRNRSRSAAAMLATLPFALVAMPLAAQSYAVVQPVPGPASSELSSALQRLARNPADFDALVAAGKASLALDDVDAAMGFFGRAEAVRAGDPRVKAGLASANLKSGRPIEAITLFDQAAATGAIPASIAADRGLAYDLVGDNVSAQNQYKIAVAQARDDDVIRRLAISQAIAGDSRGFEATLLPLLQRRDLAAYRARAFGLAILGKEDEAISIVEAVMPRDLAERMTPYLRYMPRLTRAQQAAAANLGNFPRAAQIGRDDPRFAQYAGPATAAPAGASDSRLAPQGEPLGPRNRLSRREERRQGITARTNRNTPPVRVAQVDPPRRTAAVETLTAEERRAAAGAPPPPPPPPPPPTAASIELPPVQAAPRPVVVATLPPSSAAPGFELSRVSAAQTAGTPPPVTITPTPVPSTTVQAAVVQPTPVQRATVQAATAQPATVQPVMVQPTMVQAATVQPLPPPSAVETLSLEEAFADFGSASTARAPATGAVDVTTIKPKREVAAAPPPPPTPPPPPKPKVPSRIWVQVATGKDMGALAFDWRRFARKSPELLGKRDAYTAKWGVSQRLLTGPIDSARTANKLVADLKAAGIDAFTFTSEAGEDVSPLK